MAIFTEPNFVAMIFVGDVSEFVDMTAMSILVRGFGSTTLEIEVGVNVFDQIEVGCLFKPMEEILGFVISQIAFDGHFGDGGTVLSLFVFPLGDH